MIGRAVLDSDGSELSLYDLVEGSNDRWAIPSSSRIPIELNMHLPKVKPSCTEDEFPILE